MITTEKPESPVAEFSEHGWATNGNKMVIDVTHSSNRRHASLINADFLNEKVTS